MLTSLITTSGLRVYCRHFIWFWQAHFHWSSGRFSVPFLAAFPSQLFIIKHHTPHWYSAQNPVSVDGIQCLDHIRGVQATCSISIHLYICTFNFIFAFCCYCLLKERFTNVTHQWRTSPVKDKFLYLTNGRLQSLFFMAESDWRHMNIAVNLRSDDVGQNVDVVSDIRVFVWLDGPCSAVRMLFPPEPYISGEGRDQKTETFCRETRAFCFSAWLLSKTSCLLCPAAVLWCSGSHIYGVSEGQWRLLPGSARCLCRRVNCQPHHPSDALEPPEGRLPEPALTWPGWGNSTRCTLPLSASAWPESRWNQPCFSFFPLPFL